MISSVAGCRSCGGECRQGLVEYEEEVVSSSGTLRQTCAFLSSRWQKVGHWVMLCHFHCHAKAFFSRDGFIISRRSPVCRVKVLITLVSLTERWPVTKRFCSLFQRIRHLVRSLTVKTNDVRKFYILNSAQLCSLNTIFVS